MAVIYAYGTLRRLTGPTVQIPGILYDLGHYPGAILGPEGGPTFLAERTEHESLAWCDAYEGFRTDDPANSLYLRRPYLDGWLYTYNRSVAGRPVIESGDWVTYQQERNKQHG